ncbi:hypothetical protein FRC17_000117, partial [Serendipita sp. 399]
TFDGNALLDCIKTLIRLDAHWIPQEAGHSLYIRPTLIGTQKAIGVNPPSEALLFVICSPVGPYYPTGFKPVSLMATTEYIRAAPGGTGGFKLGANYAPGVVPQKEAAKLGYSQNLWLLGPEHYLTEVGTMNMFLALQNDDGSTELVTPPLDDVILPGVTRDSVLVLAREHASGKARISGLPEKLIVSERPITMKEVKEKADNGKLIEIFGTGTAAIICPVERIGYLGKDIIVPTGEGGVEKPQKVWEDTPPTSLFTKILTRGRKRPRESSDDEDSFEENIEPIRSSPRHFASQRPRHPPARPLQPMTKRQRRDTKEYEATNPLEFIRGAKSDSFSEEEDEPAHHQPPRSIEKPTPTPPTSSPSQYSQANGLLRSLHLHRSHLPPESSSSRLDTSTSSRNKEAGHSVSGDNSIKEPPQETHIGDAERDRVTRLYEEANRALGLLSLQRRQQKGRSPPAYSESEESSDDTEEE